MCADRCRILPAAAHIPGMTTNFDEALHPRGQAGRFTTADHAADDSVALDPHSADPLAARFSEALMDLLSVDGSITLCRGDLSSGQIEEGDFNPLWDEQAVVDEIAAAACRAYREGSILGLREEVMAAIAEYAATDADVGGNITVCTRVWEAWSYGTMTADDFEPISEDADVLGDMADAVLDAASAFDNRDPAGLAEAILKAQSRRD